MEAKQLIVNSIQMSVGVLSTYLEDMTGDEIFLRPTPEAKHTAWQLGHLIASNEVLIQALKPEAGPDLPEGFSEKHTKETADSDEPTNFYDKDTYLNLLQASCGALCEITKGLPDSDLDKPSPEPFGTYAPTMGDALSMMASHNYMHSGQIAVLRRKLGKPIVI